VLLPDVIGYLRLAGNIISPNRRGSRNAERVDALARSSYICDLRCDIKKVKSFHSTMEQEPVALGHDVQVVDPDVRGYVYSLVTAVSAQSQSYTGTRGIGCRLILIPSFFSSEGSMARMQTNMCWVMMPSHVCVISRDG